MDQPAGYRARGPRRGFLRREDGALRLRPHLGPSRSARTDPRRPLARRPERLARQGSEGQRSARRGSETAGRRGRRRFPGREPRDALPNALRVQSRRGSGRAAGRADRVGRSLRDRRRDRLAPAGRRRPGPHRGADRGCPDAGSRARGVRQGSRHPFRALLGARSAHRSDSIADGRPLSRDARPRHRARREAVVLRDDDDRNRPKAARIPGSTLVARRRCGRGGRLRARGLAPATRRRARPGRLRTTEREQLLGRAGTGVPVPGDGPARNLAHRGRGHRARVARRPCHPDSGRPLRGVPRSHELDRGTAHRVARGSERQAPDRHLPRAGNRAGWPCRIQPDERAARFRQHGARRASSLDGPGRRHRPRGRLRRRRLRHLRGHARGVFRSRDGGARWENAFTGLPGSPVRSLAVDRASPTPSSPGRIRVSSGPRTAA